MRYIIIKSYGRNTDIIAAAQGKPSAEPRAKLFFCYYFNLNKYVFREALNCNT